jgi:hypothetical protein
MHPLHAVQLDLHACTATPHACSLLPWSAHCWHCGTAYDPGWGPGLPDQALRDNYYEEMFTYLPTPADALQMVVLNRVRFFP